MHHFYVKAIFFFFIFTLAWKYIDCYRIAMVRNHFGFSDWIGAELLSKLPLQSIFSASHFFLSLALMAAKTTTKKYKENSNSILLWPSHFNYGGIVHLLGCLKFVRLMWYTHIYIYFFFAYFDESNIKGKRIKQKKNWERIFASI